MLSLVLHKDIFLASGAMNGTVHISNIVSGEVLHSLSSHSGGISALAVASIDRYVLLIVRTSFKLYVVSCCHYVTAHAAMTTWCLDRKLES